MTFGAADGSSAFAATYLGNGTISLSSDALGPYTGYVLDSGVNDDCSPGDDCGRPPDIGTSGMFPGGN